MMINKLYLAILILLCCLGIQAQNISFDLPFMNENEQPELFFLDPTYNKDNQVDHYSFGNILKVQYEYDSQRRPVKKSLYVLDKYDREWPKTLISEFKYKDGQLVSEQTTQFRNDGVDVIYELTKTISHNKTLNIDTIRTNIEWHNERFSREIGIYSPQGYTIRYLNGYNLPDSTLQVKSEDGYSYFIKQYYTYNDKQQLVHCKAIHKESYEYNDGNEEPDAPWADAYTYVVNYGNNKTEYIQTSILPDLEEYEMYEYYRGINSLKTKKNIIQCTIETDNKGRIISKQLLSDKKVMLDDKYRYDSEGRTNVEKRMNLDETFLRVNGSASTNNLLKELFREFQDMKYTVNHDGSCENTVIYIENKKLGEINICLRPEDNKPLSMQMTKYDGEKIRDRERDEYRYLPDGSIEKIKYEYYGERGLVPDEKYVLRKDAEDRIVESQQFTYDDAFKQWIPKEKKVSAYDQYGYLCHKELYTYGDSRYAYYDDPEVYRNRQVIKDWEGKHCTSWINDAKKNPLQEESKIWINGQWGNYEMRKFAYNDKGERTLNEYNQWDLKSNAWTGVHRDSTYSDESNNVNTIIDYSWLDDKQEWVGFKKTETESEKYETDYNSDTQPVFYLKDKTTTYNRIKDRWMPSTQRVDNRGESNRFYSYSKWDVAKKTWYTEQKSIERTDENGISYIEDYYWNEELNQLEGRENTTTIPFNKENSNRRIIYKVWNFNTQNWKDAIACNVVDIGYDGAHIYEKYDEKGHKWQYDRKVEYFLSTDKSAFIQSYWKRGDWVSDLKIVYYKKNDKAYKSEIYAYQPSGKTWKPLYCVLDINENGKENTYYMKWDEPQNDWGNYLVKKEVGWNYKYYQWNENRNKYLEKDIDEVYRLVKGVEDEFNKINLDTKYDELIH